MSEIVSRETPAQTTSLPTEKKNAEEKNETLLFIGAMALMLVALTAWAFANAK